MQFSLSNLPHSSVRDVVLLYRYLSLPHFAAVSVPILGSGLLELRDGYKANGLCLLCWDSVEVGSQVAIFLILISLLAWIRSREITNLKQEIESLTEALSQERLNRRKSEEDIARKLEDLSFLAERSIEVHRAILEGRTPPPVVSLGRATISSGLPILNAVGTSTRPGWWSRLLLRLKLKG